MLNKRCTIYQTERCNPSIYRS